MDTEINVDTFTKAKPRLFSLAYRMLGTRDDAEDIVQEAYIRWHNANQPEIETPEAWLVTVVTRLSIDRLRKISAERKHYIGPWLPEPLVISGDASPEEQAEFASDLSLAFVAILERLSPVERAVFLLHDIFDLRYPEIARIVGKGEGALRQLVHRARSRVRNDKPRFRADESMRADLIRKFAAAAYAGNEQELAALFSEDIALTSDGGGKITAARKVITGKRKIAHLFAITASKNRDLLQSRLAIINGEIGGIDYYDGKPAAVTAFTIEQGKITKIHRVMNPDKLRTFHDLDEKLIDAQVSQRLVPGRLNN